MSPDDEVNRSDRVEVILQQLQSLPTLSIIATRLLQLTSDDDSDVRQIVQIIESDPALTAKILSLCRRADVGLGHRVVTVERAVVLMGFEAIRNAALSVEIFRLFDKPRDQREHTPDDRPFELSLGHFDAAGFWQHSIAVAAASEMIASLHSGNAAESDEPDEAFVCGLLHDLGKLALDRLLPKSYQRVVQLAEQQHGNIAEMERRVIGLDHHTAGKRLAELWRLPHVLQDVLWLHGQPFSSLPDLPHRRMIGIVSLADCLVRKQHIGFSGNHIFPEDVAALAQDININPVEVENLLPRLHEQVNRTIELLGLTQTPSEELFLESIARANHALGMINSSLERRSHIAARQERILKAISDFHQQASPGQSLVTVCGNVIASAAREFGRGFYALLYPMVQKKQWHIGQFSIEGRLLRSQALDVPTHALDLESLSDDLQVSVGMMSLLPILSELAGDASDLRRVRLLPLRCGWGVSAVLIHDRSMDELGLSRTQLLALCETWASTIAAACQHEGAKRLGEQLAESNRSLTETQAKLAQTQAMAALGEMAAGAAHEMNNPLCVISGRSQVLVSRLPAGKDRRMAEQIVEQAQRLSDLITSLHLFAEPPNPKPKYCRLDAVIAHAARIARERSNSIISVMARLPGNLPEVYLDEEHITLILIELIVNAIESGPKSFVEVQVQVEPNDGRLILLVRDDGQGMSDHTMAHAFDPFFSDKPAGRQPGLGLARAQRLSAVHGGAIELQSQLRAGTTARLCLPYWKPPGAVSHAVSKGISTAALNAQMMRINDADSDETDGLPKKKEERNVPHRKQPEQRPNRPESSVPGPTPKHTTAASPSSSSQVARPDKPRVPASRTAPHRTQPRKKPERGAQHDAAA